MWQVGAVLIRTGPRTHKEATELVLEQAKVLCQDWAGSHFAREKQSALRFFLGKRQDKSKNPMGPVGLERNGVSSCKTNNLRKSEKSSDAESGALFENPTQSQHKTKVEFILSLIDQLSPAEFAEFVQRLAKATD